MDFRNSISFEAAINALAQLARDIDLSVHVAIDLAGRIVRASQDVAREDIGIVFRADREVFSVCTRENENVYIAKDMSVLYPWERDYLDGKTVLAIAQAACVGQVKAVRAAVDLLNHAYIEAEHGHVLVNRSNLKVVEVLRTL
jgi:hypothetical protein